MQGFGQILGPVVSNWLTDKWSFEHDTDVLAIIWGIYAIFYLLVGGGLEALRNPTLRKKDLNDTFAEERQGNLMKISEYIEKLEAKQETS